MIDQIALRQRDSLRLLWRERRLSRWELHERLGVNPNAVGMDIGHLLNLGIVRECQTEPHGPGRPRVPLEIDPIKRHVIGLALSPGRVEVGRLNLRGHLMGKLNHRDVLDPEQLIATAQVLFKDVINEETLGVGLSTTGFVDPVQRTFSSALPGRRAVSLDPIYQTAGALPILLENDMHALAARWLLTHESEANEDVLLVAIDDGQFGGALLIDGHPNRGCAIAANELGHTRFFVDTDICYCGHPGCLERICSTPFIQRIAPGDGTLMQRAAAFDGSEPSIARVIDFVSAGLANAVNFIRAHRLVFVSELTRHGPFMDHLLRLIRSRLLSELVPRVRIDLWDQPGTQLAETAGWLALASLYREGWVRTG